MHRGRAGRARNSQSNLQLRAPQQPRIEPMSQFTTRGYNRRGGRLLFSLIGGGPMSRRAIRVAVASGAVAASVLVGGTAFAADADYGGVGGGGGGSTPGTPSGGGGGGGTTGTGTNGTGPSGTENGG